MAELHEFITATDRLVIFESKFKPDGQTIGSLTRYAARLQELWEDVSSAYDTVRPSLPAEPAETPSSNNDKGQNIAAASAQQPIEATGPQSPFPDLFNSTEFSNELYSHSMTVPPCEIPMFQGTYEAWPTFRDLFNAVYIRNGRLSDVERLFHLLHSTSRNPKSVIQRFPLPNDGFQLAWSALSSTYGNRRVLVNSQMKKLFGFRISRTPL